jgi:YNFM family putative membrane transporter
MAASLAMSAPLLGMGLGLLLFATWSDAIGRCHILIVGTAVGLCISFLLPLVDNYNLFLILRFSQGAFLAVCPAVAVPLLGDELRKSWLPAAVGFYIASNTIGGIISRVLAGIGAEFFGSWQASGYIIGAISAALFVVVHFTLPKQRHFSPSEFHLKTSLQGYTLHLRQPKLIMIYLIIGLAFGCFVNLSNYLMLVLEAAPYHLPSDVRSLMFLTLLGGTTSSSFAGKYARKHSLITGMAVGICIMLLANLLLEQENLPVLILGMVLMAMGFFFCHAQASALVGRSVKKAKGSAQALYSLFYYTGASAGVFLLEPAFLVKGWRGVLETTQLTLMGCIVLVTLCQLLYLKNRKASHQTA